MASGYLSISGRHIKGGSVICEESFRQQPYGGLRKIKRLYWFPRSKGQPRRADLRPRVKIFQRFVVRSTGGHKFRRLLRDCYVRRLIFDGSHTKQNGYDQHPLGEIIAVTLRRR